MPLKTVVCPVVSLQEWSLYQLIFSSTTYSRLGTCCSPSLLGGKKCWCLHCMGVFKYKEFLTWWHQMLFLFLRTPLQRCQLLNITCDSHVMVVEAYSTWKHSQASWSDVYPRSAPEGRAWVWRDTGQKGRTAVLPLDPLHLAAFQACWEGGERAKECKCSITLQGQQTACFVTWECGNELSWSLEEKCHACRDIALLFVM